MNKWINHIQGEKNGTVYKVSILNLDRILNTFLSMSSWLNWSFGPCTTSWNTCIDVLVQERHNSSALAMELRLSCTNHRYMSMTSCAIICWFGSWCFYLFMHLFLVWLHIRNQSSWDRQSNYGDCATLADTRCLMWLLLAQMSSLVLVFGAGILVFKMQTKWWLCARL